ncbi:MAG: PKD domain-containing protein, partial [Bacteroidota bacterium]
IPPVTGLTYSWTNGAGNTSNPYVSPNVNTTYILTVSDGTCNFAFDTVTVNVNPKPNATFTYASGCGLTVNFTNTSSGIQSSLWYFGDGDSSVQTNPVHTYLTTGNYTVTLIVTNSFGCKDTIIQLINIVSTGLAGSQFTFQIQNCTGTVVFTNQSVNATGYTWNFGDGSANSTATNPSHTYLTSGTFTVTLIATNSCSSDTTQQQITINIIPSAIAAFTVNTQPCSLTISLTNQSQNGITYQWNFGDGSPLSTVTNPTHNYLTSGTYSITLIATNSCGSDTLQQQIILNVPQAVVAGFTINVQPCSYTINITNQSQNGTSYQWNFGDGSIISTITNPSHIYSANGTYTVTLLVSNACSIDSLQQQVTINVPQAAIAAFTINTQPCDLTVSFSNQSLNGTTWQWNFGDTTISSQQNPSHTYTSAGIYNISLIVSNSCSSDTLLQQVDLTLAVSPQSDFEFSTQPCDLTLSLINQSQNADSLLWNFGDGNTDTTFAPIHFYLNNGIYSLSLITYNQCGTDTLIKIVVDTFSQGIALFDIEQKPCKSEVQFFNQSQNAFSYLWNFGDGNSDTTKNPIHEYLFAGNYTITLTVNDGTLCADTMSKTETIINSDTSNLFVPNCFTPNGDTKNEVLEITGFNDCETYHLSIYNRWGQSVYETDDINKFWDGKFKGENVPDGVYFLVITGKQFSMNRTVTVIR